MNETTPPTIEEELREVEREIESMERELAQREQLGLYEDEGQSEDQREQEEED